MAEDSACGNRGAFGADAPKVSVVIPMYYAEEYVDELLGRLRAQPLKEIEIICVIDGSPDATLDKVEAHAAEDPRISWIYQENSGAGSARNAGLERARGEYLAFLDADDLYDPQFLSKMYGAAKEFDADLVVCQFEHVDFKSGERRANIGFKPDRVPAGVAFSPLELENPFTDFSVVPNNKLFRRSMVEREELRFSTTATANDVFFALASIASSEKIVALQERLVEVRRYANSQSITSNRSAHTDEMFTVYGELSAWLEQRGLYKSYEKHYIESWTNFLHYNAAFKRNERFIELAAKTLACDEPWRSMSDEELVRAARLNLGVANVKRLLAARRADSDERTVMLRLIDSEIAAISEIVQILNSRYGKHLPERADVIGGLIDHLKRNGVQRSVQALIERLLATPAKARSAKRESEGRRSG